MAVCFALIGAGPAYADSALERQVLVALNAARANPAGFAQALKRYRGFFRANIVEVPGEREAVETTEGVRAVDETISVLQRQAPLETIQPATLLAQAAADHVAEQARSGSTGHGGRDGSSPGLRVKRRGGGAYVAEVIAYGPVDAVDVIRQLIVDDGVADRGHRKVLYSPELRFAGVSCGPHPEYRTMCVIDLGVTPDGRMPDMRFASR